MSEEWRRARESAKPRLSSHREFGFVMAGAFLVLTLLSAWRRHGWPPAYLPALSVLFALFAAVLPRALAPLNAVWTLLGRVLHAVMGPLVLGALYYGFFTPFGLVFRFFKKDPLRLELDRDAASYWIPRESDKQPGEGMANQF